MRTTYVGGRQPGLLGVVWVLYATVSVALWRHQIITEPVSGGLLRAFAVTEVAAAVGAPLASVAVAARAPVVDLTSPRRLDRYASLVAVGVVAAFAVVPLVVRAAVVVAPGLLPRGTPVDVSTEDRPLVEIYPGTMASAIAAGVALTVALALLATALAGVTVGTVLYGALLGAVVVIQASRGAVRFDLGGAGDPPYALHGPGLLLAALAVVCAVLTWGGSRAAAAPLGGHLAAWVATGLARSAGSRR